MRKILLSVLAATTALTSASPALAQRSGGGDRENAREERSERAQSRQERAQQQQQGQRPQRAERAHSEPRADRAQPEQPQIQPAQPQMQPQAQPIQQVDRRAPVPQASQTRERAAQANRRGPNVNQSGRPTLDPQRQAQPPGQRVRPTNPVLERESRAGTHRSVRNPERHGRVTPPPGARPERMAPPPPNANTMRAPTWSRDWRRDHRHDWRGYRERNRSHFRVGVYIDPFGWGYHRWNVGWRLWPSFYSSHFWLNDPFMYRLPYAPFPYRWVRYYDDVLLVNTMNGQVVDVIYDFFW